MLKYRTVVIAFRICLAICISLSIYIAFYYWPFILLLAIFLAIIAYGSLSIRANFYFPSVCKALKPENAIAITFDDGPSSLTPEILDILQRHGVKATFFCIGEKIPGQEDIIKRIDNEGHIVGNHSYSHHLWFDFFTAKKMRAEITQTEELISACIGKKPVFFRPPYGVTNPSLKKALNGLAYVSIGWSLRSFDTTKIHKDKILKRLKKRCKSGDIVLFHDNRAGTPELLDGFLQFIGQAGIAVQALDKLTGLDAYHKV